jgi:CRP-like cAMP-binding protein
MQGQLGECKRLLGFALPQFSLYPFVGVGYIGIVNPEGDTPSYRIWGADNVVYGPVDLPTLVHWVEQERVTAGTWVHLYPGDHWQKAARLPELKGFFEARPDSAPVPAPPPKKKPVPLKPGTLRRVKILSNFNDTQLERFVAFMELRPARAWEDIVREGSPGDAMYLLLEGEVRVRLMIAGKETILTTLAAGEFFGEVALFDHGPRSADVIANKECLLLRIPAGAFQRLVTEAPDLAAPFLFAIAKTLIARIRADNKRYRDSIAFARTAHQ